MSGAILPLPQYAFMAWCLVESTETTLPLPFEIEGKKTKNPDINVSKQLPSLISSQFLRERSFENLENLKSRPK
jgi:hypothetical protein